MIQSQNKHLGVILEVVMRLKFLFFPLAVIVGVLFSGCSPSYSTVRNSHLDKIAQLSNPKDILIVEVPAAGNAISNTMIVASLNAGVVSSAMEQIITLLEVKKVKQIGVIGENSMVNMATIKGAINQIKTPLEATIITIADGDYSDVVALAKNKGIELKISR